MDSTAWCCKCRRKVKIADGKQVSTSKSHPMIKGTCKDCGCKVARLLPRKQA